MKNLRFLPITLIAIAVLAGCSTLPASDSPLAQARDDYNNAQANPQVTSLAASELKQASDSLDKANRASSKGRRPDPGRPSGLRDQAACRDCPGDSAAEGG